MKRNQEIRSYAREKKVALWEIAEKYGVSEVTFIRHLRKEFTDKEKEQAINYINIIHDEHVLEDTN